MDQRPLKEEPAVDSVAIVIKNETFVVTMRSIPIMRVWIENIYRRFVLGQPMLNIALLSLVLVFFVTHIKDFRLDASADTLLLDNDIDLKIFRDLNHRYASKDFLFVTFTPHNDLFSDHSLRIVAELRNAFRKLEFTDSVTTLLDVPLVKQFAGTLSELAGNYRTLESDDVDLAKARAELLGSDIFGGLLISLDGDTTAMQINLKDDDRFRSLLAQRNALILKKRNGTISADEETQLARVIDEYQAQKDVLNKKHHENINQVRAIMQQYETFGALHLGGVTMIADDMITFIKRDLVVFGLGVFVFLVVMLGIIFRKILWIMLPLISCLYAGVMMIGVLGYLEWNVTVISSNFISLMLILTMSMNIHLVVRYRQLQTDKPNATQHALVLETVTKMVRPCLYTALTTIIAFSSLVVSDIKPVIDFGWMMTMGLVVTFLTTFLLFPALLVLLKKPVTEVATDNKLGMRIMSILSSLTIKHGNVILGLSAVLGIASIIYMARLEVENSFINYFGTDTEIYRGLKLIDDKLGGTATLDIVLRFDETEVINEDEDFDFDFDFENADDNATDYWFTPIKVREVKQIHDYLETLPAVGKVLSLASLIRVGEDVNQAEFDAFELAIVYKRMPDELKAQMIDPYLSIEHNEARINLRVLDSLKDLRRKELLDQIRQDLTNQLGFSEERITVSGLLVLYNNMLQSLFRSQILTLGMVMAGIALMLLALFRSVSLAIIGIIPNILAAGLVLGLMGFLRIPLDMMTITIAAITIGIAVDNSIHYIYRFREEFAHRKDYIETVRYCHANIGRAIFYNALTIIVGFSILMLSNFIPTVYFGMMTALAMVAALFASLTLLPKLILICKPFALRF